MSEFAALELFLDTVEAVEALQPAPNGGAGSQPPFSLVLPAGVVVRGCVTLIRPDDAAIRDEDPSTRPGLRYRDLVRHHGHRRLVMDFGGLRVFGHPFHDDLFAILRELGCVGGRFAVCGAAGWYTDRLAMYQRVIRVVDCRAAGG